MTTRQELTCCSAIVRMSVSGGQRQFGYAAGFPARCRRRSGWPALGYSLHSHVYPVVALGDEPGMLPEPEGGAVVQDVASDGQMAGIGLIQQLPDQPAPDSDAAELREQGDVDDADLVVGSVDDEPPREQHTDGSSCADVYLPGPCTGR